MLSRVLFFCCVGFANIKAAEGTGHAAPSPSLGKKIKIKIHFKHWEEYDALTLSRHHTIPPSSRGPPQEAHHTFVLPW